MSRARTLALGSLVVALALPATAMGQATRTWVSGSGNDANPCSHDAPCKTWAGAISKTAAGGEMNALDAGGFGGVTITKSLTIRAVGVTGGVLVAGTNAIVVNAAATDSVVLDGLDINGIGTGAPTSLSGVKVLSAASVRIEHSDIYRFRAGITFAPVNANAKLVVNDVTAYDNSIGIIGAPGNAAATGGSVLIENSRFEGNICGAVVSSQGTNASTPTETPNCGAATTPVIDKPMAMRVFDTSISNNTTGLQADGTGGTAAISNSTIAGNGTGLLATNGGQLLSLGGNDVLGNGTDGQFGQTQNTKGFMGPQGVKGDTGAQGATGPQGPAGPQGRAGARGLPGKVQLVTCKIVKKKKKCTTKLVSKPVKFTTTGTPKRARATLTRSGRVYARGRARISRSGVAVSLRTKDPVRAGRYVLKLWSGRKLLGQRTVVVT